MVRPKYDPFMGPLGFGAFHVKIDSMLVVKSTRNASAISNVQSNSASVHCSLIADFLSDENCIELMHMILLEDNICVEY